MIFSKPHRWEGHDAIQVLVFSSEDAQKHYQNAIGMEVPEYDDDDDPNDISIKMRNNQLATGVAFTLRAIHTQAGWAAIVRCGFTGILLKSLDGLPTSDAALAAAFQLWFSMICDKINVFETQYFGGSKA